MSRTHILRGLTLMLAAAIGCETATEPTLPEGVFVLQSIEGQPLPAVTFESAALRQLVAADTLEIDRNGTGLHIRIVRTEFADESIPAEEVRQEGAMALIRVDGALLFDDRGFCSIDLDDSDCALLPVEFSSPQLLLGPRRYVRVIAVP